MGQLKISFRAPEVLWKSFTEQAKGLFLSRGPFLNHMIAIETPRVAQDLGERRLTLRAKRYISGELKKQGAKSVNIEVEPSTAEALNKVVTEHNLVRDAFLCRLLVFLRGSDKLFKYLGIPELHTEVWSSEELQWPLPNSPLKAMAAVMDDPFYFIRYHLDAQRKEGSRNDCGIYMLPLPRNLDWAACYLADEFIPGTKARQEVQRIWSEEIDAIETDAFATTSPTDGRNRP